MLEFLFVVTVDGYAKRVPVRDIPRTRRGRQGVRLSFEPLAGAVAVDLADEVLIATSPVGNVVRLAVADVPVKGRRARGVRAVKLPHAARVSKVAVVPRNAADDATMQPRGA